MGKSTVQHQDKKPYQQEGIWQTSMIRSVRNSSIGFSKSTRNKPENQDKDAQGKIEQQQALSFGKCSQHEWGPQMMSKEKGTSIKVGTQKGWLKSTKNSYFNSGSFNNWFQSVIGCLTECIGNVHIAALHIVPSLMSKLPTSNIMVWQLLFQTR